MTDYQVIYDAFLAKITADDWPKGQNMAEVFSDWVSIMESALPYFKFPRHSLKRVYDDEFSEGYFVEDLNSQEIQIIATLMKKEWLDRTINTWENVKVMYDERDFSQANLLDKFIKLSDKTEKQCIKLQKLYSRSIEDKDGNRKPYQFSKWAGNNDE